jgi:ABC-2 type transport system permease protein
VSWFVLAWPFAMLLQALLLTGAGLLLAPLAVLYGDVQRLMRIVTRLLFYFSPIIYGVQDIKERLGPLVASVYILNPLAGIFDLYRCAFFPDQWLGWDAIAVASAVSTAIFILGAIVFRRLEGDVLKEI